jgi:hypothetical protein
MTRTTAAADAGFQGEDDELYYGVLVYAKFVKSKIDGYADQIEVEWELRQGAKVRDWPSVAVGQRSDGTIAKLRQMLNALAEKAKDAELWFDADTLEWGYDLDGDDTTPAYAKLTPGMVVSFKGEMRKDKQGVMRYRVTGYKAIKVAK